MERRMILTALGAVVATPIVAAPVLAQTMQPSGEGARTGPAGGQTTQGAMNHGAMGRAEMEHVDRTMKLGAAALATARVGMEKAENARVKMFAQLEVAEQETIADVLKSMKENEPQVTGSIDKPSQQEVTGMLDAEGRTMLDGLQKAQRGAAFDREFIQGQIMGHRKLLEAQEDYLRQGRNREHAAVAKLARGHIKEHLMDLEMIQSELGRRG